MIGDPLKKVTTGQPFVPSAASWNAFAEAARAHLQKQSNHSKPYRSVGGDRATVALVQNTGSDVGRFGVLAISQPIVSPDTNLDEFSNYLAFTCAAPSVSPGTPFVITLEPIAANGVGMAVVSCVVQCQVNIASAGDQYADMCADAGYLQSGSTGPARILWKDSGTGVQWAIVSIGNPSTPSTILCRVKAAATGAQYTVVEQVANGPGFSDKPSTNLTATNLAEANVGPGGAVDLDRLVLVDNIGGNYVFDHPVYAKYLG